MFPHAPPEPRFVLVCMDADPNVAEIALVNLVRKYREGVGYRGSIGAEFHGVLQDRPIEERLGMLTPLVLLHCDLVVWSSRCAEVGSAMKLHLEQAQGRAPGTMHYGVIAPVPGRHFIYKSDLYLYVPDDSDTPAGPGPPPAQEAPNVPGSESPPGPKHP